MRARHTVLPAIAMALMSALSGCGSSSQANVTVKGTTTISTGQELLDLRRALGEGAISQRDYDKVRAVLLQRKS